MKKRSPLAVFLFGFITLGFYSWYWEVKTKGEMNKQGQHIPTAWIWLIPFIGYLWWAWKYSEGAGNVTKDQAPAILVFLLMIFTGPIGDAIIQHYFNTVEGGPVIAAAQGAPAAGTAPATSEVPAATDTPSTPEAPAPATEAPTPETAAPATETTPSPTPPSTDSQAPTPPAPIVQG